MKIAVLLAVLAFASEANAQDVSSERTRAQLLQQLPPGMLLRVRVDGHESIGRLRAVTADTVFLEDASFATSAVAAAWIKQRSTRKGRNIGALIGAPIGAVFGVFLVWFADALCEGSCDGVSGGELALGGLVSGAFGMLSGGTIGSVIGATIPRWGEIANRRTRVPADPELPIGSLSIAPAYTEFAQSNSGGGLGARASYTFETRTLAVGFDVGGYRPGTTRQFTYQPPCTDNTSCFDTAYVNTSVFHVGGVARVVPGGPRGTQPYASLGVGVYTWESGPNGTLTLAGYSLGAGLQVRNRTGRRALFAEARWQSNLSHSGNPTAQFGFYGLALGSTIAW